MTATSVFENLFQTKLRPATRQFFWVGLAMVLLGVAALVFPVVSTLALTLFIGWILLTTGVLTLVSAFSMRGAGPFFGALLLSLLSIVLGLFLVFSPAAGALALTLTIGGVFAVQAAYEIAFAFEMRPSGGWVAMLVSGIASAVVAALIIIEWPAISMVILGVLFGVNFISTGFAYVMISRALKG